MEELQNVKQRFGIIGMSEGVNRSIEKSLRVAPTDISVLVTGESGVGKENIPKIIHQFSHRKHSKYIAVNCGAIPEGTIDSELFGHEKGAFTGATSTRKGYFEVADGGTIFLDEVGELPMATQVRLLRVLETGEFIKVGSSVVQKTNVRIVAATNMDMNEAIQKQKFREDLFYRLSTVEINIPPLRERKQDIPLLFRKFASDFAEKYRMPSLKLNDDAVKILTEYHWQGNIRQLRNIAEQMSVLEKDRILSIEKLRNYLPNSGIQLPAVVKNKKSQSDFSSEREILYKVLFDMKNDLNELKKITMKLMNSDISKEEKEGLIQQIHSNNLEISDNSYDLGLLKNDSKKDINEKNDTNKFEYAETIEEVETLSILDKEIELIKKALERSKGKRKLAADELGISERTLYRKIKQYDLQN
ncbi:sigma-54 dependent transcriptional regulator [Bacteroidota bacterium]|nr:sigma-54 dependent transcriptional regulator [Bacteroidota bacterium]